MLIAAADCLTDVEEPTTFKAAEANAGPWIGRQTLSVPNDDGGAVRSTYSLILGIDHVQAVFDSDTYRYFLDLVKDMTYCRGFIVGLAMAWGGTLAYAETASAPMPEMRTQALVAVGPTSQQSSMDRNDHSSGVLGGSLVQRISAVGSDNPGVASSLQDSETVLHRVRSSVGAVTEQSTGVYRPTPKLGGVVLFLLAVFATVLGVLSLRWHRETAE